MKERIRKIWTDPVLSNVIAIGIIGLITLAYNYINSRFENTSLRSEFISFWTKKFDLWFFVASLTILWISVLLFKKFGKFKYDEETLKLDRELFNKIRSEYLTSEMMSAPKSNSFSSHPFESDALISLFRITNESKNPSFEFINPRLERRKKQLIAEVNNLDEIGNGYIFGTNNSGWLSIPFEWEYSNPEKLEEAIQNISKQEDILSERYDDFIKLGRRILKV